MAALKDLARQIEELVVFRARRPHYEQEKRIEQYRDEVLMSGALPGEFTIVLRYRRSELLRPEIR